MRKFNQLLVLIGFLSTCNRFLVLKRAINFLLWLFCSIRCEYFSQKEKFMKNLLEDIRQLRTSGGYVPPDELVFTDKINTVTEIVEKV